MSRKKSTEVKMCRKCGVNPVDPLKAKMTRPTRATLCKSCRVGIHVNENLIEHNKRAREDPEYRAKINAKRRKTWATKSAIKLGIFREALPDSERFWWHRCPEPTHLSIYQEG